jgi:hypothetical protein
VNEINNNGMFTPVGAMSIGDELRLEEARDEAKRWRLSSMVSSGVVVGLAIAIGMVASQRDEAREEAEAFRDRAGAAAATDAIARVKAMGWKDGTVDLYCYGRDGYDVCVKWPVKP